MVQGLYTVPARRSRVTGGCTRVALTDARACGAAVHEVLSLLQLPPKGTVADQLQDQDAFTIFSKMTRVGHGSGILSYTFVFFMRVY